jgi:hypothetical protein
MLDRSEDLEVFGSRSSALSGALGFAGVAELVLVPGGDRTYASRSQGGIPALMMAAKARVRSRRR